MKQVVSVRDLEVMLRAGQEPRVVPADALLTPSARDFLRDIEGPRSFQTLASEVQAAPPAKPVSSKNSPAEIDAFFKSPRIEGLKAQLCDIGRRLWQRAYVDGNGGNMAIRVGEDIA